MGDLDSSESERLRAVRVDSSTNIIETCYEAQERLRDNIDVSIYRKTPSATLQAVADYICGDLSCKTIIVQSPILERDYSSEYAAYYATSFRHYSRYSIRLHCFANNFDGASIDALTFLDSKEARYLGFVTVRPIRSSPIGRTLLACPAGVLRRKHAYLKVKNNESLTIAGRRFSVSGAPFIQQDSAVGVCAHASLWMALNGTYSTHKKPPRTLAEIGDVASTGLFDHRVLPARDGLTVSQLQHALHKFGYHGISIRVGDSKDVHSRSASELRMHGRDSVSDVVTLSVYPYLESGIPVVLLLASADSDHHAVLAIGHDWTPVTGPLEERDFVRTIPEFDYNGESLPVAVSFAWPTSRISSLLIHNDSGGPYKLLAPHDEKYKPENVVSIVPVLQRSIRMDASEAQFQAEVHLGAYLYWLAEAKTLRVSDITEHVLLRPLLVRRHVFREWAKSLAPTLVTRKYRTMFLPKFIWIYEIYDRHTYFLQTKKKPAMRYGELLVDATGDPDMLPAISIHLNSALVKNRSDEDAPIGLFYNYMTTEMSGVPDDYPVSGANLS